jgi:hypothetical protein
MVTSCVLVCSCTSCGQTLLLLHRTQSLAYVLGLALDTLLGVWIKMVMIAPVLVRFRR